MGTHIMITCEHAGNYIPEEYRHLFENADEALESHRGWDIGVDNTASYFAHELKAPLFETRISRLLVDCNRSVHRPDLFSDFSSGLDRHKKQEILEHYYYPYRKRVEEHLTKWIEEHRIIHISVHTFTPIWKGEERPTDIGLLLDESRSDELKICREWKNKLEQELPGKTIHLNEPYGGWEDGFTSYFRKKYSQDRYLGIETEMNQKYVGNPEHQRINKAFIDTLRESLEKILSA